MTPTPEQFRAVGFTGAAAAYPLSPAAQEIVAEHNGVSADMMPETFRYAPNPAMRDWLEALGASPVRRHESGRWLLPSELAALA